MGQRGRQHCHVRDHVKINTPSNMATLKTTSIKVKELSTVHGKQHGHVQDYVHMNTPFNTTMLKTTSREVKKLSKVQRGHQQCCVAGRVHCQKHGLGTLH
ncbi:unnamed protein product [Linum trigynum]|uniref:Uncharacterized protein n=1 Tax=Linum trigynum TaxID=586398 RepID=A0AAV2DZY4_9ROSI